ncbi:glycoside hydrolase family 10 protein [Laceyella putida]|uniref:Glycoside hydrolase family 10 protein n=1 Tax=Laceyella putida TaxID=110101 RepID=A0ABW2RL83_9BACL
MGFCLLALLLCLLVNPMQGLAKQRHTASSFSAIEVKRQLRAAWIATVTNIDWPSKTGLSKEQQQAEFNSLLDELKKMGINAVIVQVRPTADAFYPSTLNPWSKYLSGTQGISPGYDPLAFMVQAAHKRNMEFHAWFNPYRVSMDTQLSSLVPNHPARQHPDWVVTYSGKLWYDPGIPAVRAHIVDSIKEVVQNYDIDAVHFDDYFYPYPDGTDFPDEKTYQTYGQTTFPNKADWRRNNVNQLVKEVDQQIKQLKPYVKFGISPFGIWRNKSTDPTGSDTSGFQAYDSLYADSRTWIRQGWIDYIAPQIYWNIGYAAAAYEKLVPWWANEVNGRATHLYIGHAVYKIGSNTEWNHPDEIPNQLQLNQQYPQVKGSIFFSTKDLLKNPLGFAERLRTDLYRYPSLIPVMPWLGGQAPSAPTLLSAIRGSGGTTLTFADNANQTSYFVIYRFAQGDTISLDQPRHIVGTMRKTVSGSTPQIFQDETAEATKSYTYLITAVDRLHHESNASNAIQLRSFSVK